MSRKTKEEAEKTRARILASALSLFVKNGYERTTFTDIAARLKMTKGAVYWHFVSKECLLMALVDELRATFQRHLDEQMPKGGLTFQAVAETLIRNAQIIVQNPKSAAFFLLMQTQVKWGADSMAGMREKLLVNDTSGPYHSLVRALESDLAAGRIRREVDPVAVAAVGMAIWTGLVRSKVEKFLECDLEMTLRRSFDALWASIKK